MNRPVFVFSKILPQVVMYFATNLPEVSATFVNRLQMTAFQMSLIRGNCYSLISNVPAHIVIYCRDVKNRVIADTSRVDACNNF